MNVAFPAATKTDSGKMRLPLDAWDLLRKFSDCLAGAPYPVVVVICFRLLRAVKQAGRLDLLSPPVIPVRAKDTRGSRLELSDEAWSLIREFSRDWRVTSAAVAVTAAVRLVDRLSSSESLDPRLAAIFRLHFE